MLLRNERTLRTVGNGYAEVEYAIVVLSREDEVVLAILFDDVIVPHLLFGPCHILHVEDDAVIGGFAVFNIIPRQHVVVLHLEVTAIIVESSTSLPVVAGIDEQFAVKHIG